MGWDGWKDVEEVRRRLAAGADPEQWSGGRPLHRAAVFGSPEVVAELARRVADVDAVEYGGTALWEAVMTDRPDNARALVEAGADPWRRLIGGWSPGRLALAGPTPDLFPLPEGEPGLSDAERAIAEEGGRLRAALGTFHHEGTGLACVAGIDADEAIRRLEATPVPDGAEPDLTNVLRDPFAYDFEELVPYVGVTTVPGGCVVTQPWGYAPSTPGVHILLSAGTVSYGLYANAKSGNQGSVARDGVIEGWDLSPGGAPGPESTSEEVLLSYVHRYNAVSYSCAYAGLRPADARAVVGPPDVWVKLPRRDYWSY
ncbi:ankyrin repeat domain-containing protein [Streptomyces sp. NPDC052687]|uniref:ankyrin repeat domain-containing protein n=1 Tax=Streptomyces sp. NPDC052687 TaxID=3154759 RepID=UPI00341B9E49